MARCADVPSSDNRIWFPTWPKWRNYKNGVPNKKKHPAPRFCWSLSLVVGGWTNPILKKCARQYWIISPRFGVKMKHIRNHQPALNYCWFICPVSWNDLGKSTSFTATKTWNVRVPWQHHPSKPLIIQLFFILMFLFWPMCPSCSWFRGLRAPKIRSGNHLYAIITGIQPSPPLWE